MKSAEPAWKLSWVYETPQGNIRQVECQRGERRLAASFQGLTRFGNGRNLE